MAPQTEVVGIGSCTVDFFALVPRLIGAEEKINAHRLEIHAGGVTANKPVNFAGFFAASPGDHLLGLFGGAVWGIGTVFNFVAASFTGVAISYAIGQSAPMVAALWGVLVWKEFAGAGGKARIFLALMFYILALLLVSRAYTAGAS